MVIKTVEVPKTPLLPCLIMLILQVVGLGVSGRAAVKLALARGADVVALDSNPLYLPLEVSHFCLHANGRSILQPERFLSWYCEIGSSKHGWILCLLLIVGSSSSSYHDECLGIASMCILSWNVCSNSKTTQYNKDSGSSVEALSDYICCASDLVWKLGDKSVH